MPPLRLEPMTWLIYWFCLLACYICISVITSPLLVASTLEDLAEVTKTAYHEYFEWLYIQKCRCATAPLSSLSYQLRNVISAEYIGFVPYQSVMIGPIKILFSYILVSLSMLSISPETLPCTGHHSGDIWIALSGCSQSDPVSLGLDCSNQYGLNSDQHLGQSNSQLSLSVPNCLLQHFFLF